MKSVPKKVETELRAVEPEVSSPVITIPTNKLVISVMGTLVVICIAIGVLMVKLHSDFKALKKESNLLVSEMRRENSILITELEGVRAAVTNTYSENMAFMKILHLSRRIDKKLARNIAKLVCRYSRVYGRDVDLVLSIIFHESKFKPKAKSPTAGALGLMQLMPSWKKVYKIKGSLYDIETNINYGLMILGSYQDIYKDLGTALTVYNRGPSRVDLDLSNNRNPDNGYSHNVMKTYSELKELESP